MAWLSGLSGAVERALEQWSLDIDETRELPAGTASLVLPVRRPDGMPAVLKLGLPHMEADHEIHGLRRWNGDPTVLLFEADESLNALLLECCSPGTPLTLRPEPEQDVVIAGLLERLWRVSPRPGPFRPLSRMLTSWSREARSGTPGSVDAGLLEEGLRLFEILPETATESVLLATDLHAGNVLRAQRRPWMVIDPKPFVGDPAYDVTQHLLNCESRMSSDPLGTVRRVADLTGQDAERVGAWVFARLATGFGAMKGPVWTDALEALSP